MEQKKIDRINELLENTFIQTPDGKKHPLPRKGKTPPQ